MKMKLFLALTFALVVSAARGQIYIDSYRFGAATQLFLDAYPNANLAYSFRKLRENYTGNCINVRNASTGRTFDIGFVSNYLDTVRLKDSCLTANCFIVTWYDQSGNSRNASNSTATQQPRIASSGAINKYKGTVAALFAPSSTVTFLSITDTLSNVCTFISAHEDGTQDGSVSIHKPIFAPSTDAYVDSSNGYGFGKLREGSNGFGFYIPSTGLTTNNGILNSYVKASSGELIWAENISAVIKLYKNNSQIGTTVTGNNKTSGFLSSYQLGANQSGASARFFTGNMYEFIIYEADKSTDRTTMSDNIKTFYNLY